MLTMGVVYMKANLLHNCKVLKVFNNNVLLVDEQGKEKILFGKGIGFGKHIGDIINKNIEVEKVFSIEDKDNSNNFNELISYADNNVIGLCEEIICMISDELGEELNEKIHISLTDHINFALKRLKENEEIQNPFLVETETLYRREFDIAAKAARTLEKAAGVNVPEGEIGFIALHIHSARNDGKLSNTLKYNFLSNSIVEFIEDELNMEIDRQSLDYARFITHIRFAIERILTDNPIKNDLITEIKNKYKGSYELAQKVAKLIEEQLDIKVVEDEIAYMAIHIERFKMVK